MFLESGPTRPNPYNPSGKRLPRELPDNSGIVPLPRPELPSDGIFATSASEATIGFAIQAEEQAAPTDQNSMQPPQDERAQHGYL